MDETTKKLGTPPSSLRWESYDEGPILAKLHHEEMPARGLDFAGPYHEIYRGDPRKVAPSKRRTLLRQPVTQAALGR